MATQWMYVFAVMTSLAGVVAQPSFTLKPVNTAALSGTPGQLSCRGDFNGLTWTRRTYEDGTHNPYHIYYYGGNDVELFDELERYDKDESNLHDLVIKNVSPDIATFYTCTIHQQGQELAKAAFNSMDKSTCSVPKDSYPERATPDLTCGITYAGPMKPHITWSVDGMELRGVVVDDSDDDEIPPVLGEERRLSSKLNVTVTADMDNKPFICRVHFLAEDQLDQPDVTGIPPEYEDTCPVLFRVKYSPRDIWFDPDPNDFEDGLLTLSTGSVLTCNATGSEPMKFQWQSVESDGPQSIIGNELSITMEMIGKNKYTCYAKNEINREGVPRTVEFTVIKGNAAEFLHHDWYTFVFVFILTSYI